jgi:hypothetical protein
LIKDQNNKDVFKCPACKEVHTIIAENLPRIKALEKLLTNKPNEIYRNKDVEELKEKLAKLKMKTEKLESYFTHPHE